MRARRPARLVLMAILVVAFLWISGASLAVPAGRTAVGVHLAGRTALAKIESSAVFIDRGTITGSPIGSGRITLVYTLRPVSGIASTTFEITNARGTVTGRALSSYAVTRLHITFTGTGSLTGGTGAYAGIRARPIRFDAIHSLTGRKEAVALTGRATLP